MSLVLIMPIIGILLFFLFRNGYKDPTEKEFYVEPCIVESGQVWRQKKIPSSDFNESFRPFYIDYKVIDVVDNVVTYIVLDREGTAIENPERYFYSSLVDSFVSDKFLFKDF